MVLARLGEIAPSTLSYRDLLQPLKRSSILMKTSSLLILFCAAVLLVSSGCKSRKARDNGMEQDLVNSGENLEGGAFADGESIGMPGESFQSLPRITDVSFNAVLFGYNNYQLDPSEYAKMDAVVSYLQNNSRAVLVVEGHCDERGTEEYNMSLGEFRAQSVRSYILSAGIEADRIQTTSFGKTHPAVPGSGESVWRLNRRGEFALYAR